MIYAISATATHDSDYGTITCQIPTFYLDSDVQGIVDAEHAAMIAKTIIHPFPYIHDDITVSAVAIDAKRFDPHAPSNAELAS